jgi:hypothetical protein
MLTRDAQVARKNNLFPHDPLPAYFERINARPALMRSSDQGREIDLIKRCPTINARFIYALCFGLGQLSSVSFGTVSGRR